MDPHDTTRPAWSLEHLDRSTGPLLLEFGASWCAHCRALEPHLARLLEQFPEVAFQWIEDGPGKPLGRSYRVTLWPTLIFFRDGKVVRQLVRPSPAEICVGLEAITKAQE